MLKFFTVFILLMSSVSIKLHAQSNAVKAKAYYLTAVNEYKSRNYSKAIEYCQQVEDMLGKTNARVESVRLRSYYDDGKTEKAKKSLQAFLSLDPDEDIMKEVSSYIVKIEEAEKERVRKEEERIAKEKKAEEERKRKAEEAERQRIRQAKEADLLARYTWDSIADHMSQINFDHRANHDQMPFGMSFSHISQQW